jgi:hypothetical protein
LAGKTDISPEVAALAGPPQFCEIKSLPRDRLLEAAANAKAVFPGNAPQFAAAPGFKFPEPMQLAAMTTKYWGPEPRTLGVTFLDGGSQALRKKILDFMNAWYRLGGGIKFAPSANGEVRITRGGSGYWSYLGVDILLVPAGQPTMSLQGFTERMSDAEYRRVVPHETGHTQGFVHEQLRSKIVARIVPSKAIPWARRTYGWPPALTTSNILTPQEERSLMGTPEVEETSVLCYWLPGEIMVDGVPVAGGTRITAMDAAFCRKLYPRPNWKG